jgi:hypothetical protein
MIEQIVKDNVLLGLIIRRNYNKKGIQFFTPPESAQQLGFMRRPKGYVINAHYHVPLEQTVTSIQEVLFLKSGKVRVDFYDENSKYHISIIAEEGDVVFLSTGGHGFEMLEETEIFEVKSGPYLGDFHKVMIQQATVENNA